MVCCSVLGCKSRSENKIDSISFHSFPCHSATRKKWIVATSRVNWMPTKNSKICSLHFDEKLVRLIRKNKVIKKYSLPTKHIGAVFEHDSTVDPIVKRKPPLQGTVYEDDSTVGPAVKEESEDNFCSRYSRSSDTTLSAILDGFSSFEEDGLVNGEINYGTKVIRFRRDYAGSLHTNTDDTSNFDDIYSPEEEAIVKDEMDVEPIVIRPRTLDTVSTIKTKTVHNDHTYAMQETTVKEEIEMDIGSTVVRPPDDNNISLDPISAEKTETAYIDHSYSVQKTIIKEEMDIGPTRIQSPNIQYMPPPCELDPAVDAAVGTTYRMDPQNDCETDTYSVDANKCTSLPNEEELKHFFENISGPGTGFVEAFEYESPGSFFAIIRYRIVNNDADLAVDVYKEFIEEFMKKYSKLTKSNWIVRNSFPNLNRLIYRRVYTCQLSSFNKKKSYMVQRNSIRRNNCKANIDITVDIINETSCKKNILPDRGYNIVININQRHSHSNIAEVFSLFNCNPKLIATFNEYFDNGMTPTMAQLFNETKLIEETQGDIARVLADCHLNPCERDVQCLYSKWRRSKQVKQTCKDIVQIIEGMKTKLPEHTIIYKHDPRLVIIITPIMKRVFEVEECKVVYVDSSRTCDRTGSSITLVYTHCKVGALPIACAVHTKQNEAVYKLAFAAIKEALEEIYTHLKFHPHIIMTDDSIDEINALRSIFPGSRLLLYAFHICRSFWRWLCDDKHKVDPEKRQSVMIGFRKMLFANNPQQAQRYYEEMIEDDYVITTPCLLGHITKLWERCVDWVIIKYRSDRPYDLNYFTETSIRIFKDIILQRCRKFNVVALAKFVTTIFENYQRRRLWSYENSHNENYNYTKLLFNGEKLTNIYSVGNNEFKIQSDSEDDGFYTARLDTGFCDCSIGKDGMLCKHLCYIDREYGVNFKKDMNLLAQDRLSLAKIAHDLCQDAIFESNNMAIKQEFDSIDEISIEKILPLPITCEPYHKASAVCEVATPGISQKRSSMVSELEMNQFKNSLDDLNKEFTRLSELFSENPTSLSLRAAQKFTSYLKNIRTISEAQRIIFQDMK